MIPTPKLRWINRPIPNTTIHVERVLQQWWAIERDGQVTPTGEWRDVPLEKEV